MLLKEKLMCLQNILINIMEGQVSGFAKVSFSLLSLASKPGKLKLKFRFVAIP